MIWLNSFIWICIDFPALIEICLDWYTLSVKSIQWNKKLFAFKCISCNDLYIAFKLRFWKYQQKYYVMQYNISIILIGCSISHLWNYFMLRYVMSKKCAYFQNENIYWMEKIFRRHAKTRLKISGLHCRLIKRFKYLFF